MENKRELLTIGNMTARMMNAFARDFIVHEMAAISDLDGFLRDDGDRIEAIAAYGAEKVPADLINALPNLKIISCYGVGYDGIDAAAAALLAKRLGRVVTVTSVPDTGNITVDNTTLVNA